MLTYDTAGVAEERHEWSDSLVKHAWPAQQLLLYDIRHVSPPGVGRAHYHYPDAAGATLKLCASA
jgi:hypothetical protein